MSHHMLRAKWVLPCRLPEFGVPKLADAITTSDLESEMLRCTWTNPQSPQRETYNILHMTPDICKVSTEIKKCEYILRMGGFEIDPNREFIDRQTAKRIMDA